MKARAVIAQIPVVWDIERNLAMIHEVLAETRRDEVVVLPEGALSGYGPDLSPLPTLDPAALRHAINAVADMARHKAIHLFCGSLLFEHGSWFNAALHFSPQGGHWIYRKINLAIHERGHLTPGSHLPVLPIRQTTGDFRVSRSVARSASLSSGSISPGQEQRLSST